MVLEENKHFEIIPDHNDENAWNVRILKGPFTETVLKYGVIKFNEIPKNMSFNFNIVYTPDTELTRDDFNLQDFAGALLEKIISNGIKDKSIITREIIDADNN
tara:strand:+ start:7579 stop:7887 length:309 start_codon:yes stop_codon:yes gene_type:complete